MTFLEGTTFPDFSSLQTELRDLLSPLSSSADLRIQFPPTEFDISSARPTITVSIKDIAIYNRYQNVSETDAPLPIKTTLAVGIYIPKMLDSTLCYSLFSETARILSTSDLGLQSISCSELEYMPDLRHYCLRVTAVMKPKDICEEAEDGDTDI